MRFRTRVEEEYGISIDEGYPLVKVIKDLKKKGHKEKIFTQL